MPYLWMVLAVAQEKYMPDIAIGTLVSNLVPLGLALQVIWIIFLIAWTSWESPSVLVSVRRCRQESCKGKTVLDGLSCVLPCRTFCRAVFF